MIQQQMDYDRTATAINYIETNFKNQPSLDEVADSGIAFASVFNNQSWR